jgi:hypothetical protein
MNRKQSFLALEKVAKNSSLESSGTMVGDVDCSRVSSTAGTVEATTSSSKSL